MWVDVEEQRVVNRIDMDKEVRFPVPFLPVRSPLTARAQLADERHAVLAQRLATLHWRRRKRSHLGLPVK